jgi:hypothetical protein
MNIEPESPMNRRAGWKLCGRAGRRRRDRADARRETVEAVDEVHRVDQQHAQEHGDEHALVLPEQQHRPRAPARAAPRQVHRGPLHAHEHEHPGRGRLAGELGEGVEAEAVVQRPDHHDHAAGDEHRERLVRVVEGAPQHRQLAGDEHAAEHAEVDPDPAEARDRDRVHVTAARDRDRAPPQREPADQPGQQVGDDGRGQPDQEVLPDREPHGGEVRCRAHGVRG